MGLLKGDNDLPSQRPDPNAPLFLVDWNSQIVGQKATPAITKPRTPTMWLLLSLYETCIDGVLMRFGTDYGALLCPPSLVLPSGTYCKANDIGWMSDDLFQPVSGGHDG